MIKFTKKRNNVERKKKKSKFISHEFPRFLKKSSSSHRFIILRIESRFKFTADFKLVRFRLKINNDLREMESEESLLSLSCARERAPPLSLHFEFEHEFETIRQVHKFCTSASRPSPPLPPLPDVALESSPYLHFVRIIGRFLFVERTARIDIWIYMGEFRFKIWLVVQIEKGRENNFKTALRTVYFYTELLYLLFFPCLPAQFCKYRAKYIHFYLLIG